MLIAQLFAFVGLLMGIYGLRKRFLETRHRTLPADKSPLKGNPSHGIIYAFTTGMMPWAKESTRLHMIAYLRGIGFHIGIFSAIGVFLISPFLGHLPSGILITTSLILFIGAILGAAGGLARLFEHNLRALSLPDDHFAVWVTTLFILIAGFSVINDLFRIPMYLVGGFVLIYIPLGKIRHCLYFFFSRIFFGRFFGRRAVFPHPVRS